MKRAFIMKVGHLGHLKESFIFSAFNNILLDTFVSDMVSLTRPIGQNSDEGNSDFRISGEFTIKENCHNSRNSHDIDMK